ncbi:heme o synthase [Phnomibacter ginsenosidimutans]|jgi:protoheme IX farnesyltransferase|uniref:Protoheme IX farnesyltransferase n=1 Tax=Phnomibacter ginsenosidimutans TaxID=2676868 RepID=A0A6I6GWC8_9BACT|nr:heme o synthase [Phnomibacter ginsenosidimutans]QGW29419.1 protoheme IX farnesyltransferase [Phnomibacter ginsenosidimutans]
MAVAAKLKDYLQLIKFTLNITVVFSSVISYLLVPNIDFNLKMVLLLTIAGLLVTGSANAINQIYEKDSDALMKRTGKRPIAAGRMSKQEAWFFAGLSGAVGVWLMWYFFNIEAALLSLLSLFIYGFVYTPLKKVSAISVLVGAFPGAFPCLIGWVAGADGFTAGGWILFSIQFIWQFPHFWAIAWVAHRDYDLAGFKLLPNQNEPTRKTALQAIGYSLLMVPLGFLPNLIGLTGVYSMWFVLAANVGMIIQCIRLYKDMTPAAARRVMFSSYVYLPIVLLSLLADKL